MQIKVKKKGLIRSIGPYYAGASGPFTPLSLSNLYAWYKADAGVFSDAGVTPATSLGVVTQWNDQSGVSGVNLGAHSTGIVYNYSPLNGLPTIRIDASDALLATMSLGGAQVSVWAVLRAISTSAGRIASYGVGGSDTGPTAFIAGYFPTTTEVRAYNNGDLSTKAVSDGAWSAIATVWDGAFETTYVNNSAGTPVASTPTFASSGQFTIFNATNFGNATTGDIAEIVVVKGALTGTDRSNLAAYSSAPTRWGV